MPPHLKKPIYQAYLKNSTYEQIVKHLQREVELNGLEAPDELQINTATQNTANTITNQPKPTCR